MTASASDTPVAAAPAVGISLHADVGNGMQLVTQTHVSREEALNGVFDQILDRLHLATTRQRAKAELENLLKHLEAHERQMVDKQALLSEAEADHQKKVEALVIRVNAHDTQAAEIARLAREAWEGGNRRGEYKETPQTRQQVGNIHAARDKLKAEVKALEGEKDKARRLLEIEIGKFVEEIARTKEAIKERQALISPAG